MTPSELLLLISEEMKLDPTLRLAVVYSPEMQVYAAELKSEDRSEIAVSKRLKSSIAKVLGEWNGDGEFD